MIAASPEIRSSFVAAPRSGDWHDDSELLAGLRLGVDSACEHLVRTFGGQMLKVARRFFRCEHDAADAVQDAFASAFQSIDSFAGGSRLSTWLHRIVVNACLMKLRSQSRRREVHAEDGATEFDTAGRHRVPVADWEPYACMESAELMANVRRCIDQLPEPYRVVLLLRDIEEKNTEETATLLGETCANVKTRLHRARHALRAQIEPFVLGN